MLGIRGIKIEIVPISWNAGDTYSVRIDVQGPTARYSREQVIPSPHFGSHFDLFMSEAVESIRQEIDCETNSNVQIGMPTL